MKTKIYISIIGISLCGICSLWGQSNYPKLPFASYLMLPVSAPDEALGGVKPNFWNNPASVMMDENKLNIFCGYRNRLGYFNDEFISGKYRVQDWSVFGQLNITTVGDIEARQFATSEPDYYFSANRANLLFGGATKWKYISLGIAWRHIHERLELRTFDANTFSAGVNIDYKNVNLGISVSDYGKMESYYEYKYPAPTVYHARLWFEHKYFSCGGSLIKPDLMKPYSALALEIFPVQWVTIRTSYPILTGYNSRSLGIGAGFRWNNFKLDYSFSNMNEMGDFHTVSIGYELQ